MNNTNLQKLAVIFILLLTQTACSSVPKNDENNSIADPLESVNRSVWQFNWQYADKYVLKPAAEFYVDYVNEDVRSGLLNMAENLNEPASIINNLLQGKFSGAAVSSGRFIINSTVGVLGIFDVATELNLEKEEESFAEVLGYYDVGDGPYLMLPVVGPSSAREEVGNFVDRYYWPLAALEFWPNLFRLSILGLEQRAALIGQEALIEDATDSYDFVKDAYYQRSQFKLHDGEPPIVIDEQQEAEIDAYLDEIE